MRNRAQATQSRVNERHRAQAAGLARRFTFVIRLVDADTYEAHSLELPEIHGRGKTWHGCYWGAVRATGNAVATMLNHGQRPPLPIRVDDRNHRLRIRVTAEEKLRLESAAIRESFRSVSDYVRNAALRPAG